MLTLFLARKKMAIWENGAFSAVGEGEIQFQNMFLEQERHRLRQQLELMEDEYEQRIVELQSDIDTLKSKLAETDTSSRLKDSERSTLVAQLTEQNHRLTSELQACLSREEELQTRISQLRDQVCDKRATVQDHVTHLEILREEMELVTRRKNDLEKKVEQLIFERDQLNAVLDESSDKILMLEKQTREQDCQLRSGDQELSDLRTNNQVLSERLESLSRSSFNSYSQTSSSVQMSLLNEMEMSTSGSDSDRSLYLRRPCSQIDEEIEDDETSNSSLGGSGGNSGLDDDSEMTYVNTIETKQLKEEMLSAYQQLKALCLQLHRGVENNNKAAIQSESDFIHSCIENHHQHLPLGHLNDIVLELKNLVMNPQTCPFCHTKADKVPEMTLALKQKDLEIKKRDEEIASLQSQLSVMKVQLSAAEEQCQTLQEDLECTEMSKDTLIQKAWDARDSAVKRKNSAEVDLAKERVASMQVNSQLMEAIQQKVELSQQLEQWQVDMEQLLEGQMRERLNKSQADSNNSRNHSSASAMSIGSENSETSTRAAKLFSFFQRA